MAWIINSAFFDYDSACPVVEDIMINLALSGSKTVLPINSQP